MPVDEKTYFNYILFGKIHTIENTGFIPKLWDFSNTLITKTILDVMDINPHFRYLDDIQKVKEIKLGDVERVSPIEQLMFSSNPNDIHWRSNTDKETENKIKIFKETKFHKFIEWLSYDENWRDLRKMLKFFDTYRDGGKLLYPQFQYP